MQEDPHAIFMLRAIELSEEAALKKKTGGAFGAVIVLNNEIVGEGYNQVIKTHDPTWHAEMHAIREACQKLKTPHLQGCILYTSAEPCPMCLAAAYWARIERIFYASTVEDAKKYGNFQDVDIYRELTLAPELRKIPSKEFLRKDAVEVWRKFAKMPNPVHY